MIALPPDVTIAEFDPDALSAVLSLEQRSFGADAYTAADFRDILAQPRHVFLVAWRGRQLVGYAAGLVVDASGYLVSIAVDPGARGQGIGRALMSNILSRLVDAGATGVELHVRVDNTAAIRLYERFGFQIQRLIRNYYADGTAAYLMRREGQETK